MVLLVVMLRVKETIGNKTSLEAYVSSSWGVMKAWIWRGR